MEYLEYLEYLEICLAYFPYILYAYVCLTFLPKSFGKIRSFAKADYVANCIKYHRCYAPNECCHIYATKQKARKVVTRVYPKKKTTTTTTSTTPTASPNAIKRQVQVSAIQTQTNVNQIAKMFESGGATTHVSKQINWVTPTILPEIRTHTSHTDEDDNEKKLQPVEEQHCNTKKSQLLQENIKNSANLLNQATAAVKLHNNNDHNDVDDDNWRSEPIVLQRRTRPNTLSYAGTSATPSTASPAASSSLSASPVSTSPLASPVLRFNMKSSFEDIFAAIARQAEQHESFIYAGCNALSPVTSIEDILAQRRLSRPLSAYSISDLLNDNENAAVEDSTYVENFLRKLNKT